MKGIFFDNNGNYPSYGNRSNMIKLFKSHNAAIKFFNSYEDMMKFFNPSYQVYTVIHHSQNQYPLFLDRGFHICNKTGSYVLVKDDNYQVMRYE